LTTVIKPPSPTLTRRRHPPPPLFPYTTLFRSRLQPGRQSRPRRGQQHRERRADFPRRWNGSVRAEQHVGDGHGTDRVGHRQFQQDRKSTRLNSSHVSSSYAVFCLKKKSRAKTR